MKKLLLLLVLPLMACCSSDEGDGISLSSSAKALAMHDQSNYGIYKGIFVGSSGVVEIDINNTGGVSAMMLIDGQKFTFSTSEQVTEGQPIENLTFISGNKSFDFNVSSTGQNPQISSIDFQGHADAVTEVVKELSFMQVTCFQGTFSGDDSGIFNLIRMGDSFHGIARPEGTVAALWIDAEMTGSTIAGLFEGGAFSGSLSGNTLTGTWTNTESESGTWTCRRKL